MIGTGSEKRKLPRFHITPCQFHDSKLNKNFSVQDVSMGGLALRLVDREDLPEFSVGTEHTGLIKVEGLKIECRFQVKFIRRLLIGAEWNDPSAALLKHLDDLSRPQYLGEHLKHYEFPDLVNTTWYHNPVGVDLLLYRAPSTGQGATAQGVQRWTLYIHQSFVQWEIDSGVKTGQAVAEDEEGYAFGVVHLETRLIDYDASLDRRLIEAAIELIEHAPIEDLTVKQLIHNQLLGSKL